MGLIFCAFSNLFVKKVVQDLTSGGIDWQREKWQSGLGSKFIHQGEKNAAKYADEVIVLSKGVQDYFNETYGRETHFIFIGELLEQGKMSVKVLKTNDTWYGMTYHEDVAAVKDSFKKMLESGVYKADLFSDL